MHPNPSETKQPVCAIVGAGPANGAAIARKFVAAGAKVALLARDLDRIAALAKSNSAMRAFRCDARDASSVATAFASVRSELGVISTLVYNAGGGARGDALTIRPEHFEDAWRVNALGGLLAAREVLPQMIDAGAGSIVFVGATASRRGGAATAAFAPAKAAQRSLAESLARCYGPKGIHVSVVVIDAVIDEPRIRAKLADKPDEFFCKPDAVADTVLFLSRQERSAWTFELEVRPFGEKW